MVTVMFNRAGWELSQGTVRRIAIICLGEVSVCSSKGHRAEKDAQYCF